MAVQNENSRVQYSGNGSTETAYTVPFYFFDDADLVVVVTDASGVDNHLSLHTDYTVEGAGMKGGGSLTTLAPVHESSTVTVYREVSATQLTSYEEADAFPASSHERALDRLTMLVQQIQRGLKSSLRMRESDGEWGISQRVINSLLGLDLEGLPICRTADQIKTWLSLDAPILNFPTKVWEDATDRTLAVPNFKGQIGVEKSTLNIFVATGESAGNWAPTSPSANSVSTEMLANNILAANILGRQKMADGYLTTEKLANAAITLEKIGSGIFTADSTGRSKFAPGFVDSTLLAVGATQANLPQGAVIQTVYTEYSLASALANTIPTDNSVPQNTEGNLIISATITPLYATSKILASFQGFFGSTTYANFTTALFSNTATDAIAASNSSIQNVNYSVPAILQKLHSPNSTSPQTYHIRVGSNNGTVIFCNYLAGGRIYGGASSSTLTLMEIR